MFVTPVPEDIRYSATDRPLILSNLLKAYIEWIETIARIVAVTFAPFANQHRASVTVSD